MTTPYYADDLVELHLGDCRDVLDWTAADVLVTDPPYGVSWRSGVTSYRHTGRVIGVTDAIAGDQDTSARDTVLDLWGDRPAIVFGSWRMPRPPATRHRLIWHKSGMAPGPVRAPFLTQDEEIYILGDGWRPSSPPLRSVITTTEARHIAARAAGHPTPKPVGLMELLLDRAPAGVIADPFAGSGATLVAAKNLGLRAIGVEIDERYAELTARNLTQDALFTGGHP